MLKFLLSQIFGSSPNSLSVPYLKFLSRTGALETLKYVALCVLLCILAKDEEHTNKVLKDLFLKLNF